MLRIVPALTLCAAALAFQPAQASQQEKAGALAVRATMMGLDGASRGTVTLQDTPGGVLVMTDLQGLPEGDHGFHFHEKGICDPAGKFAGAGGHFTAGAAKHGLMVVGGPHGGDMPNQHVGPDGALKAQIFNTGATLAPGPRSLEDADGSALVIHAGADDYVSQPSGASGDRIACAVIEGRK